MCHRCRCNCVTPIFSETSHALRKEIRTAEDRLRRQIESDRKDEAVMAMDLCGN